jgi:glycosyltransferase involved in cell wall biosynthesis
MKMCQAFARNGHKVVLLAPDCRDDMEGGVTDEFSFYGVERCFELLKLPWPKVKGKGYIYGTLAAMRARSLGPDLVFGRHLLGCLWAARMGLPTIFEAHEPIEVDRRIKARIDSWALRSMINGRMFLRLIVISDALKHYYLNRYYSLHDRITVAPDGADPIPDNVEASEYARSPDRFQVGYVGHLYRGKGMEVVLQLADLCPWADFHVVGGTAEDISVWQSRLLGKNNLTFHGYIPHSEVAKVMEAFDVVLLPNQHRVLAYGKNGNDIGRWTSPLKAFEYMAAQKPIISSDLPVLREVLRHEHNALLCNPDDAGEWVCALTRLREDGALAKRLAAQAHQDFLDNYTWRARAEKLLADC